MAENNIINANQALCFVIVLRGSMVLTRYIKIKATININIADPNPVMAGR